MKLADLPPELLHLILLSLPLHTVLQFSLTSKQNRSSALHSLHKLDLAVFPQKSYNTLAFLNEASQAYRCPLENEEESSSVSGNQFTSELYQIGITTASLHLASMTRRSTLYEDNARLSSAVRPDSTWSASLEQSNEGVIQHTSQSDQAIFKTAQQIRSQEIAIQNTIAIEILSSPSLSYLQNLTLHLYEVTSSELTALLAHRFPHLQNLSLKLSHPFIHDQHLPAKYWHHPPKGSPVWNALAGIGQVNAQELKLRSLRVLKIDRAGLTTMQLMRWIEVNTYLKRMDLRKIRGVNLDFAKWLGSHCNVKTCKIQKVCLEDCESLVMTNIEDCEWIRKISIGSVKQLSLKGCKGIRNELYVHPPDHVGQNTGLTIFDPLMMFVSPRGEIRRFGIPDDSTNPVVALGRGVSSTLSMHGALPQAPSHAGESAIEIDPYFL